MVRRTSPAEEVGIDLLAERIERGPGLVGERQGDARLLGDARDAHLERERHVAGSTAPVIGAAER